MTDLVEGAGTARSTVDGSAFPPIADYGFLSDCEVSALVAPSGNVEWMCLPRMDGPSVFATVLDRGAGWFRFGPAEAMVPSGRRYLPGTMVLETTWGTPTGWAVVRDVLLVGPWRHGLSQVGDAPAGAARPQRRAGAAADGPVPAGVSRLRA
jgi:alpha,alpha-trehalase